MFNLWPNNLRDRLSDQYALIRCLAARYLTAAQRFKVRRLTIPNLTRSSARLGRGVLGAFFPDKCLVCGVYIRQAPDLAAVLPNLAPIIFDTKAFFDTALGRLVCTECLEQGFTPIHPPFCTSCGKPFSSSGLGNHLCSDCILAAKKGRPAVGRVRAFGCHELLLRDLVHQFKYGKKIYLARPLGRFMFHTFMDQFSCLSSSCPSSSASYYPSTIDSVDPIDLIIPVPLHTRRLRERGFNQAYLLVRDFPQLWTATTGTPPEWTISNTIFLRSRNTPSQTGFDRKDRLKNLRDAFTVKNPEKIKDKRILLIDDVYTTGATSGEAASTLLDAGAKSVDLLVLVRA